jgi:hypothetical protein
MDATATVEWGRRLRALHSNLDFAIRNRDRSPFPALPHDGTRPQHNDRRKERGLHPKRSQRLKSSHD